jgi:hypothetical protein
MLYKDPKDIIYSVEVAKFPEGRIKFLFSCDGGKFGTDEVLAEYEMSIKELLHAIQQPEREAVRDFRTVAEPMTAEEVLYKHTCCMNPYKVSEIIDAMEEYAASRTVAEREVSDEEIQDWANTVDIVRELNDPFVKTEDDLSPYQWAVFGAKWMRKLIKERSK